MGEHRDVEDVVVGGGTLVIETVGAREFTVVRGEEDRGVLLQACSVSASRSRPTSRSMTAT